MKRESGIVWQYAPLKRLENAQSVDMQREGFLAGRAMAKEMLLKLANREVNGSTAVEIVSRNHLGRGVRPQVSIDGYVVSWSLSISHTAEAVIVALCDREEISIGIDLVKNEPLGQGFSRAWLDRKEQRLTSDDELKVCRLWAMKEAVYKAVNRGDPFAPRRIQIRKMPDGTYSCIYRGIDLRGRCRINFWQCADHVAAMAVFQHAINPCGLDNITASEISTLRRQP